MKKKPNIHLTDLEFWSRLDSSALMFGVPTSQRFRNMPGASEEGCGRTGLVHVRLKTLTVETTGGAFTVRALSHDDLLAVFSANRLLLAGVLDDVDVDQFGFISVPDEAALKAKLDAVAPTLMSHIIARAADEPDVTLASRLPQGVQIDALDKIAALSFPNDATRNRLLGSVLAFERRTGPNGEVGEASTGKNPLN